MESGNTYQNGGSKDFQKIAQTVASSIQKITQNVSALQRMVNQMGSHQDTPELRKKLHSLQHYTQQLVKDTNGCLKDLCNFPPSLSHSEQRERRMQRERLQDEFTSILNMVQNAQRNIVHKEKEQINKTRANNLSDPFLEGFDNDSQLIQLQDNQVSQQRQLQEEADLRALQEQEQSVRELERDINDVNQIFKELGVLVHEQGEMVDSIEANIERTESSVRQGAIQLGEASTFKNKIRRKKLYLAIIAAVILTVVILIIVYSVKN